MLSFSLVFPSSGFLRHDIASVKKDMLGGLQHEVFDAASVLVRKSFLRPIDYNLPFFSFGELRMNGYNDFLLRIRALSSDFTSILAPSDADIWVLAIQVLIRSYTGNVHMFTSRTIRSMTTHSNFHSCLTIYG